MFALTSGQSSGSGADSRGRWLRASGGFVLPRWLRKPARFFARFVSGEIEAPPYTMAALSAGVIGAFSIYGAVIGGHLPSAVQAVTARTGFAIDEIRVSGNVETSEIDIFDRVGLDGWTSLVGFDPEEARQRIASLPWVETASVRKIYPATLEVKVVERAPYAIWQQGSRLSLIEENGEVIAPVSGSRHLALPLVVGAGAEGPAADFIAKVAAYPELASRIRGYVRISDRRWNLRLENGITIKLPEVGEDQAIADLLALDKDHALLSRDIETVDMRFGDRLIVKLSTDAAEAREASLKERLGKRYKPAERQI
ncbi:cell division protein FtsQ/DivIB [Mesorhizobium sp. CAU 1732]|uniref:cell division protein FtsQ/DivIB n=1 Tax=Mesorhizobium sp. CAU 1732 TaxID=3140358 RepID=UPI003260A1EC